MSSKRSRTDNNNLFQPKNLSFAISAALIAPAGVAIAQDQGEDAEFVLEEVLVTARKRTESLMDIPQSIQAISSKEIQQAGLMSMDDYVRFIPSMSYVSTNPGIATIVFRGIADAANNFITEPAAALYLDEQSLTLNATPDPRMVDIARVEALMGPQGTLYGASAQAGVLRVVTNKPDPTAFDGWVDGMLRGGSESDVSYDLSAMVNIPLSETFALRLVGFTAEDGGFIDNINGDSVQYGIWNNAGKERDNFNSVKSDGGRVAARWFMNDDWTMDFGIIVQNSFSNGRPERDPTLGRDLAVVRFRPDHEFDENDWTQYGLTFAGDLGWGEFISATSYFTRDWTYQQDTQTYASYFGSFCYVGYYGGDYAAYSPYCFQTAGLGNYYNDPLGYLQNVQEDKRFSQEFRLSGSTERFDWLAGAYYEKADQDWVFTSIEDGFGYDNSKSIQNYLAGRLGEPIPTQSSENTWWLSADSTTWEQVALFGELVWHINDKWDLMGGVRWFDREQDKQYFVELPKNNLSGEVLNLPNSDDGVLPKLSLSYQMNDDILFYALYSEGYRPGGLNRVRGVPFFPAEYQPDYLKNYELGAKMTLAEGRVRLGVTLFDMHWEDYQLEVIDPSNRPCSNPSALPPPNCGQPWQKVVGNVGDATSTGLEIQLDSAINENWTFGFNATWLDATLDDGFFFAVPVPAGTRLPLSPEFKGSFYLQWDKDVNWFGGRANHTYLRLQWSYTGDMTNQVEPYTCCDFDDPFYGPAPQAVQPAYNIGDLRWGIDGDKWSLQLFINNLTDERAILFDNSFEFDQFFGRGRQTINRPREYGARLIYYFGQARG